jgi:Kef-type K+ transport system membrane component KefB
LVNKTHMMPYENLLILLAAVWITGKIFRILNWPSLFGEILAGFIVGPLVLGIAEETEAIKTLADLGIFFLMFHAGLHIKPSELQNASKKSIVVAIGGVTVPFILALFTSLYFEYEMVESLFIAMGLSITAIAVAARLFKDENIVGSKTAHVTIGAAILNDVLALIIFSVILNIAQTGTVNISVIIWMLIKVILFFIIVLTVGHKLSQHFYQIMYKGNKGFTFSLILAIAFGLFAEAVGLHIIIGAFVAGLFIRQELIHPKVYHKIEDRLFGISYSFLGPIFFATLAFHLDLTALQNIPIFLGIILFIAVTGKIIGSGLPALWSGMKKVEAFSIGIAMNSRGAVELIIAKIGLEQGIINKEVFSILIIMAFVTTIISIIAFKPLGNNIRKLMTEREKKEKMEDLVGIGA